jgi:NAD(P)-dependent dehydrogenase (short-subunit alcohol dehydrogenase family)
MANILIIGATRGLGASLANNYASQQSTTVYGTTRAPAGPSNLNDKIVWIPNIDVAEEGVGRKLVNQLGMLGGGGGMVEGGRVTFDVVVCSPTLLNCMREIAFKALHISRKLTDPPSDYHSWIFCYRRLFQWSKMG